MFYARYTELCSQKDVSPSKVALDCGFNKGSVSVWKKKFLRGEDVNPSSDILLKLAEYFDVSIDYLLGKSESRYIYNECELCGMRYNSNDEREVLEHAEEHNRFITARKVFGENRVLTFRDEEKQKQECRDVINNAKDYPENSVFLAVVDLYTALFSRSLSCCSYNLNHPNFEDYVAMMLYQSSQKNNVLSKLPDSVRSRLLSHYGEKPGIKDGTSIYELPNEEKIVKFVPTSTDDDIKLALFGNDGEITDEMYDEVKKFAEYVKAKYQKD